MILDTVDALDGFHRDESNTGIISSFFGIVDTFERTVYNQPPPYLSQNNFLDPNQSGFRTAHSTETALLTVTESLRAARALSHSSVLILLNLSYAFDTVNHQIFLSTLAEIGIADSNLVHIISDKTHLSGHMEQLLVQTLLSGNLCPPRFSIRTTSVFTIK